MKKQIQVIQNEGFDIYGVEDADVSKVVTFAKNAREEAKGKATQKFPLDFNFESGKITGDKNGHEHEYAVQLKAKGVSFGNNRITTPVGKVEWKTIKTGSGYDNGPCATEKVKITITNAE